MFLEVKRFLKAPYENIGKTLKLVLILLCGSLFFVFAGLANFSPILGIEGNVLFGLQILLMFIGALFYLWFLGCLQKHIVEVNKEKELKIKELSSFISGLKKGLQLAAIIFVYGIPYFIIKNLLVGETEIHITLIYFISLFFLLPLAITSASIQGFIHAFKPKSIEAGLNKAYIPAYFILVTILAIISKITNLSIETGIIGLLLSIEIIALVALIKKNKLKKEEFVKYFVILVSLPLYSILTYIAMYVVALIPQNYITAFILGVIKYILYTLIVTIALITIINIFAIDYKLQTVNRKLITKN